MQRFPETTPHRPPPRPQVPLRQPFQATPWLPVKQNKLQQFEINMPVDLCTETMSQPDNNSQQSVRPKSKQLVAHTQNVPPSAVSWHQLGTRPTPSAQHQPSAHPQASDTTPSGLPTTMHMYSLMALFHCMVWHGTARYGSVRFTFGGFSTGYSTWYLILF